MNKEELEEKIEKQETVWIIDSIETCPDITRYELFFYNYIEDDYLYEDTYWDLGSYGVKVAKIDNIFSTKEEAEQKLKE